MDLDLDGLSRVSSVPLRVYVLRAESGFALQSQPARLPSTRGTAKLGKELGGPAEVSLRLARKEELSWDTRKYTFQLPSPQHTLGLPIGKHVFVSAMIANPRTGADRKCDGLRRAPDEL